MIALVVTILPITDKRVWLNIEVLISRTHDELLRDLDQRTEISSILRTNQSAEQDCDAVAPSNIALFGSAN